MDQTSSTTNTKRPSYFLEENNGLGLASISDLENGFSLSIPSSSSSSSSSSNEDVHNNNNNRVIYSPRKIKNLESFSSFGYASPRSGGRMNRFEEPQPHFLDNCFLCKKMLGRNRDIFMYRGDTPFCSEECRAEQIDIDETKEKSKNLSASMKALRKKEKSENKSSQKYPFHSGAVAAA